MTNTNTNTTKTVKASVEERKALAKVGVESLMKGCQIIVTRKGLGHEATIAIREGLFSLMECRTAAFIKDGLAAALPKIIEACDERDKVAMKTWLRLIGITIASTGNWRIDIPMAQLEEWKQKVIGVGDIFDRRPPAKKAYEDFEVKSAKEMYLEAQEGLLRAWSNKLKGLKKLERPESELAEVRKTIAMIEGAVKAAKAV